MKHIFTFTFMLFTFCFIHGQVPTLVGPPNIVVSCGFKFTTSDLTDTTSRLFGRIVTNLMDRKKVETNDIVCYNYCVDNPRFGYPGPPGGPGNPSAGNRACDYYRTLFDTLHADRIYTMSWGFDGYLLNSIPTPYDITIIDNRTCHQGKIERKFTAYGPNNVKVTTTQTIWVIDCDPFYINTLDPCDTLDDIDWPNCGNPIVLNGCGITNSDTIKPKILQDSCQLLSIEYNDNIITNNPEYCFTVIRTWVIIDWCQYAPNVIPVIGKWNYDQIIHVKDTVGPIPNRWLIDCKEADSSGLGSIGILGDAEDNCTPKDWLFYTYWIDLNNDGIGNYNGYDFKVGTLTKKQVQTGQLPVFSDNPYAHNKKDPADASGKYPIGKHKYVAEIVDGCGNKTRDSFNFEILPAEPPKFECPVNDFTISVELPKTFVFSLKNIVIFSEDNCTPFANLKVFLDGDTDKTGDIINCIDYIDNGSIDTLRRTYEVWIQDASGNSKICPIVVNYLFKGNCDSLKTRYYSGEFFTLKNNEIEDLDLELSSSLLGSLTLSIECSNSFKISTLDSDTGYYLLPTKHDYLNNGVDILDAILIRKHILGIKEFDHNIYRILSDLDNNKAVTSGDVSALVKRILGTFPNLPSESNGFWNFFNVKDSVITKPYLFITDSTSKIIGAKVGDLNGDALTRCNETRMEPTLCLNFEHKPLMIEKGKSYLIPFFSSNYIDIYGFQTTFQFNKDIIQIDTILNNKFSYLPTNLLHSSLNSGFFSFLHFGPAFEETFSNDDTLFTIKITALADYAGNDFFKVIDYPTYSIAYDKDENTLNICINGISTSTSETQNEKLIVYPNPVKGDFFVVVPTQYQNGMLSISDMYGKLIYKTYFFRSNNILSFPGSVIPFNGTYLVSLQSRNKLFSKKLIKL